MGEMLINLEGAILERSVPSVAAHTKWVRLARASEGRTSLARVRESAAGVALRPQMEAEVQEEATPPSPTVHPFWGSRVGELAPQARSSS